MNNCRCLPAIGLTNGFMVFRPRRRTRSLDGWLAATIFTLGWRSAAALSWIQVERDKRTKGRRGRWANFLGARRRSPPNAKRKKPKSAREKRRNASGRRPKHGESGL